MCFEACALAFRSYSDNFDTLSTIEKKFIFKMMQEMLDKHPESTVQIVGDILGLPQKTRKELQKLATPAKEKNRKA